MKVVIGILFLSLLTACDFTSADNTHRIVFKNDKEGNTLLGSKEALINAIRGGASVKIGWGAKGKQHSIEHLSDPIWIAVLDEKEVIAHLDGQILSKTDWDNLSASYADSTLLQQEWRVVLTTKGEFDAVWYDRRTEEVIQRRPQRHIMTWFAKGGTAKNTPFFTTENQ